MAKTSLCCIFILLYVSDVNGKIDEHAVVNHLSEQVITILNHYKTDDPVGLPLAGLKDPMPMAAVTKINRYFDLYNGTLHGLSKIKIEDATVVFTDMTVEINLSLEKLVIQGIYEYKSPLSFWVKRRGECRVELSEMFLRGIASLKVHRFGYLEANNLTLDLDFKSMKSDLKNFGTLSIVQGLWNAAGSILFDSVKSILLKEVNDKVQGELNNKLKAMKQTFPNSILPIDLAISQGRKYIKNKHYDPFKFPDYSNSMAFADFNVKDVWVSGLSSFYRVGNVTATLVNNIMSLALSVGTQELEGHCGWEATAGNVILYSGSSRFTIEYFKVAVKVNQALDTRKHPVLEDIDINLGNIQLRSDGLGTVDYGLEMLVNVLPNLLRNQIIDALEGPIRKRIQNILDHLNVDRLIEENLAEIENISSVTLHGGGKMDIKQQTGLNDFIIETTTLKREEGLVVDNKDLDQDIF